MWECAWERPVKVWNLQITACIKGRVTAWPGVLVIPGELWSVGVVQAHTMSVVETVLEAGKAAGLQAALQAGTVC